MDDYNLYTLYGLYWTYALLLVAAAIFDVWKYIIPNAVVMSLMVLFLSATLLLPIGTDWISHLGAAAAMFVAGALAFRFRVLGAGDVKLLTAVSLWAGFGLMPTLLLYVALFGGGLALLLISLRFALTGIAAYQPFGNNVILPRLLSVGEKVPYGVPIAAASVMLARDLPHLGMFI